MMDNRAANAPEPERPATGQDLLSASFSVEETALIRLAAEIAGEDPFDFVIASTIMHARAVLGERETIEVMPADMARIARMLDATAQPVLALQAVAARHRDVFGT